MQVAQWNYERNNTSLDMELENRMLAEEAQEFKDGLNMYFEYETSKKGYRDDAIVEMVDAWADYQFVLQGTMYKTLGSLYTPDLSEYVQQDRFMYHILTVSLDILPETLNECLQAVIDANKAKGTTKIDGKVQKGESWIDPKETIRDILKDAGDL